MNELIIILKWNYYYFFGCNLSFCSAIINKFIWIFIDFDIFKHRLIKQGRLSKLRGKFNIYTMCVIIISSSSVSYRPPFPIGFPINYFLKESFHLQQQIPILNESLKKTSKKTNHIHSITTPMRHVTISTTSLVWSQGFYAS